MSRLGRNRFVREHYEAISTVMQSAHKHNWQAICEKLGDMLKADNRGFRRERFLKACQPGNKRGFSGEKL
jgi:hypothetical protein